MKLLPGLLTAASVGIGANLRADDTVPPVGSRIQRTMRLLATSTPQRRNPVRILFYGQSIVRQDYARKAIEADLRRRFPNADLTVENRAIGGYTAPALVRTAEHDLYPFYPDLLVFHVYGGESGGQFEDILRRTRQRTTAEILTWTHHPDGRGIDHPGHEKASEYRREMAEKYQCEMVDLREIWKVHLRQHDLDVRDLLVDVVHLNKDGGDLMGKILVPALQVHPNIPLLNQGAIRTIFLSQAIATAGGDAVRFDGDWRMQDDGIIGTTGSIHITFAGNRVDLTALNLESSADLDLGSATILLDGKPVSAHPKAYAATLPTRTPIDYRPAIKLVRLGEDPQVEEWTLTAHDIGEDGKTFAFDLEGSLTGPDGSGTHETEFVSDSGRISLQPRDFSFAEAIRIRKKPLPETFDVTWKVYLMGTDIWRPDPNTEPGAIDRTTVLQGIPNAQHTLEIRANGDGTIPLQSVTIHRPPLAE